MILIADSGSTKCEWILLNNEYEVVREIKTMGFNPYFHSSSLISSVLKGSTSFTPLFGQVKLIYYYGAGCVTKENKKIVQNALSETFPLAKIVVENELKACAYACYTGEPIIGCILGTGSDSVYFDGKKLSSANPSLGFILGDIASGCYFGKKLLRAYYYKSLPDHLRIPFEEEFAPELNSVISNIYEDDQANVFLASFMKFVTDNRDDEYIKEMTDVGFRKFIEQQVCSYPNYKKVKVHFVGAVAYFFQDQIKELAKEYGIQTGYFLRKPITSLINYHAQYSAQT